MSPRPTLSDDLLQGLKLLARVLSERKTDYALIGGLGIALRGPIRTTRDIDLMVSVPQMELPRLLESLIEHGFSMDVRKSIGNWNSEHLLDFTFGHVRVDWIKAVLPVFERILDRATLEDLGEWQVRVADAEGLLLLKLIAFRPQDQEDIRGILAANPGLLELDWVRSELSELVTSDDERTGQFEKLVAEFYDPHPT